VTLRLYVNVDHVATVREARKTDEPDPVDAARACERAGADGITVHLREDRRHIQDADVERLAQTVKTVLNLELATAKDVLAQAVRIKPYQVTFVPERREEITTEGGLDLGSGQKPTAARLVKAIEQTRAAGMRVSLFIGPDKATVDRAAQLGVAAVEFHTGTFAHAWPKADAALRVLKEAAAHARSLGLAVHAGHGLTYRNVHAVAALQGIEELNIGHSIVSRSVMVGMESAVKEMKALMLGAR
jgi:pyridoxine 5-phosphate synthase